MSDQQLPGLGPAPKRGPGRPKGSGNKRAKDFKGYVEATFGGSAAQQSARVCMVTPGELRDAKGDVIEALAAKAEKLALRIGCKTAEAWELLARERAALMPYTDQKQPTAMEVKTDQPAATFVLVPGAPGAGQAAGQVVEAEWAEVPLLSTVDNETGEVSHPKSHDAGETEEA